MMNSISKKSRYKGGFKRVGSRSNNTSEYNHDYYEKNKDKWKNRPHSRVRKKSNISKTVRRTDPNAVSVTYRKQDEDYPNLYWVSHTPVQPNYVYSGGAPTYEELTYQDLDLYNYFNSNNFVSYLIKDLKTTKELARGKKYYRKKLKVVNGEVIPQSEFNKIIKK